MFFCLFFFFFFKQKTAYEIMPSLVGSEMCIRDRARLAGVAVRGHEKVEPPVAVPVEKDGRGVRSRKAGQPRLGGRVVEPASAVVVQQAAWRICVREKDLRQAVAVEIGGDAPRRIALREAIQSGFACRVAKMPMAVVQEELRVPSRKNDIDRSVADFDGDG